MDRGAWQRLGKSARLSIAQSRRCAEILTARKVQDADAGLAAMEKLKHRISANQAKNPEGLFTSFLDPAKDLTGPCEATFKRRLAEAQARREKAAQIEASWSDDLKRLVFARLRGLLSERLGDELMALVVASWHERPSLASWDPMLGVIAVYWDRLGKAQTPTREAVS